MVRWGLFVHGLSCAPNHKGTSYMEIGFRHQLPLAVYQWRSRISSVLSIWWNLIQGKVIKINQACQWLNIIVSMPVIFSFPPRRIGCW
uniref:DNA-directed DNA polymerase family protein n=1 Tax=Arundo donax TaxID=35708 RepID=A0A0A9G876_ARUDO